MLLQRVGLGLMGYCVHDWAQRYQKHGAQWQQGTVGHPHHLKSAPKESQNRSLKLE